MTRVAPDVGGFGSKLNVYREEALLCFLAWRTGKPVKWIERRTENALATNHGRGQVGEVEVAFTDEGCPSHCTARRVTFISPLLIGVRLVRTD